MSKDNGNELEHRHIDQRVERANKDLFWHYFVSQALHLSLMLICEDVPDTIAGLVLPLQPNSASVLAPPPEDLSKIGESLIGWLDRDHSFTAFLDPSPSFKHPNKYRIDSLKAEDEMEPKDRTLIVLQEKVKPLPLSIPVVETIRRLFAPLYQDVQDWRPYFDHGRELFVFAAKEGHLL